MRALIVGALGQDGRLLTTHLLRSGYEVVGIARGTTLMQGEPSDDPAVDVLDGEATAAAIARYRPDQVYYVAAFHHSSEAAPVAERELFRQSFTVNVDGYVNVLDAVRTVSSSTRVFYAASSHIFRGTSTAVQTESTAVAPICAYGTSKAAGLFAGRVYRERYGVFAATGILYNHESVLRRPSFLSKKIVTAALAIRDGRQQSLVLGDLSAAADWGYAPDYVEAFQRMLCLDAPDDFVVATGVKHTVGDFVEAAFSNVGLDWRRYVEERPAIVTKSTRPLVGDASRLFAATGWRPSVDFQGMVANLVRDEMNVNATRLAGAGAHA